MVEDKDALALLRLLMEPGDVQLHAGNSWLYYSQVSGEWFVYTGKLGTRATALRYRGTLDGAVKKLKEVEGINDNEHDNKSF